MARTIARTKISELASVLGVGIIGFGLGAIFAKYIGQYAFLVIFAGILMHGLGMYEIHAQNKKESPWMKLLYWLCWTILAGLTIYVLVKL